MINQMTNQTNKTKAWIKYLIIGLLVITSFCLFGICMYLIGCKKVRTVAVDFTVTEEEVEVAEHKYISCKPTNIGRW